MKAEVNNNEFYSMAKELEVSLLTLEMQALADDEDASEVPDQSHRAKKLVGVNAEKFEWRENLANALEKTFDLDAEEKYDKATELQVALMEQNTHH